MILGQLKKDFLKGILSKQDYIAKMHEVHKVLFEYAEFIKGSDVSKIEIVDDAVILTSRSTGVKMLCDKDDQRTILIETMNFGSYEASDLSMILNLINEGSTVFDIGGNIGWYAINIARSKKNVHVHAFEPIPKTFNYLKRNLELNDIHTVHPHNFGFSNKEQDLAFYYYPEVSGNASMANVSNNIAAQQITCHVRKLDDYILENNLSVDFIKCDVEGAELFVFQGGIRSLRQHKPVIFAELLRKWAAKFNYHPNEAIELFKSLGYRCFIAKNNKLDEFTTMNDQTKETNFFFLHAEKHEGEIASLVAAS